MSSWQGATCQKLWYSHRATACSKQRERTQLRAHASWLVVVCVFRQPSLPCSLWYGTPVAFTVLALSASLCAEPGCFVHLRHTNLAWCCIHGSDKLLRVHDPDATFDQQHMLCMAYACMHSGSTFALCGCCCCFQLFGCWFGRLMLLLCLSVDCMTCA